MSQQPPKKLTLVITVGLKARPNQFGKLVLALVDERVEVLAMDIPVGNKRLPYKVRVFPLLRI